MNTLPQNKLSWLAAKRRDQDGINMVDLMMWLVIAALLLAAAIQGIGYYQKAAYLYQIQSDLEGVGTIATGIAANEDGVVTKEVVEKALLEAKRSAEIVTTVELASDGKTPFIRGVHPAVTDKDGLYLFDACSDTYKIGVNVVPKGGTAELEDCGISAAPPGGGAGTPTADDIDGDNIPNASDPDIDGDGTPNESDTTPNGDSSNGGSNPPAGGGTTTPPVTTVGNAIGRTSTLQIAGFGTNYSNDLADNSARYDYIQPHDNVLQGALAAEPIYMFSKNTGSYHACAVGTLERDLYCWGSGGYGRLGNGTTDNASLPVEVTSLSDKTISQVAAGGYGTCAIADNTLYCWGDGWLTAGSDKLTPTEVGTTVFAGKTLTNLVVGNQFGCILADNKPYCWGTNADGEFGNGDGGQHPDGTRKTSAVPVEVVTTGALNGKTITALGAQNSGACAIADGAVYCWGDNEYGQLGNGETTGSNVPVAVTGALAGKTVTEVSGSYTEMCATTTEGILYCWGGDWGVGSTPTAKFTDGVFAGKSVTSYGFGDDHICAVASGQVYCWGNAEEFGGEWEYFTTPQLVDNGLFTGKKVLNVWATAGANFVNYEK